MEEDLFSRLIHINGWDFDVFDELEEFLGDKLFLRQEIIDEKIQQIDFRIDDFRYNFAFTLKRVLKYANKKKFLSFLHSTIVPDSFEDPIDIVDLYLEFFHSYYEEDRYEDYLLMMIETIIEGLNSSDLEYQTLSKRFVTQFIAALYYVHNNFLHEFYDMHDKEVILEFLKEVYSKGAKDTIDPYLKNLSQADRNIIISGIK